MLRCFRQRCGQQLAKCALIVTAVGTVGCGGSDRPETIPATGVVTYQGQPVEGAQVMFTATAARPASAVTDAEGRFKLFTFVPGDGVVEGGHQVVITKTERVAGEDPQNPYPRMRNHLPEKYANPRTTPLSVTVSADGKTDFEFVLTD